MSSHPNRRTSQTGSSYFEFIFIFLAIVVAFTFILGLFLQSDDESEATADHLKSQTSARFVQTVEGSNAFLVITDSSGHDEYYCTIHYTGTNGSTRVVTRTAQCLNNAGEAIPAPFLPK